MPRIPIAIGDKNTNIHIENIYEIKTNMSKQKKIFIFLSVIVIVLTVPIYLSISSENLLNAGVEHEYKFRLRPVDPHDLMRGKYIRLTYPGINQIDYADSTDVFNPGDVVYVSVKRDTGNFAQFEYAYSKPPSTSNYFTTKVGYTARGRLFRRNMSILVPFDRYYLKEDYAKQAEDTYRELSRNENMYAIVVIKDGEHVLKDVYVNDTLLPQYLREHKNEYDAQVKADEEKNKSH